MVTNRLILILFLFTAVSGYSNIEQNIVNSNYEEAFAELRDLIKKDVSIIDQQPQLLPYFDPRKNKPFFDFVLKKTNELLEKFYYKEALKFYKILSLYEKNNKELYENYKKAYVYYTQKVIEIKKALDIFKTGNVDLAREKLKALEKEIPKSSNLYVTVDLGYKEIDRRIYEDYVLPGIKKIDEWLKLKNFSEAKATLISLKKLMQPNLYTENEEKIKRTEKQYYFGTAQESFIQKKYTESVEIIEIVLLSYPEDPEALKKLQFYKEEKLKAEMQAEAYNNLKQGEFFYNNKQYPSALFYYKAYLKLIGTDREIEKRVKQLEELIEEEKRRKFFYDNFNNALDLVKGKEFAKALEIFESIKAYPYEKQRVSNYIKEISEELERIRVENEKEAAARNNIEEGRRNYNNEKYKEALDSFVLAKTNLDEIRGRERLKAETQDWINRSQNMIKEVERKKALERLKKIENGIYRGKNEYQLGNYEKSAIFFSEVLELDSSNLVAREFQELIEEAQKIQSVGKISNRDPFYPLFVSLKKSGEDLQKEGLDEFKKGNKEKGTELLNESMNKWQTIKRAYPYNEEARKNVRLIFKFLNPKQWETALKEDLERALELSQRGNKIAAYTLIKEIYDEAPNYPRIKQYLEQVKPEEKKRTLSSEDRQSINDSYNKALAAFTRREYKEALKITETIISQNKLIQDDIIEKVKSLYLRTKSRVESQNIDSLNLSMNQVVERTKLYRQALAFYQKAEYRRAILLAEQALKIDPNYTAARNLIEAAKRRMN